MVISPCTRLSASCLPPAAPAGCRGPATAGEGRYASGGDVLRGEAQPALDAYLQVIGWLAEDGTPVVQARIAERMGKSRPSVSGMLERLVAGGFVERAGREVLLTQAGRHRADDLIRRHRLAERLLVDIVGLPWTDVHAEAEPFARVMSAEVEERLVLLLGNPATCPHGNPIPGSGLPAGDGDQVPLCRVAPGETVRLVRLPPEIEADAQSLRYLDGAGFPVGGTAEVLERGPDGTLALQAASERFALGPYLCERLFVVTLVPEGQHRPGRAASRRGGARGA